MKAPFPYFGGKRSDVLPIQSAHDLRDIGLLHAEAGCEIDLPKVARRIEATNLANVSFAQSRHAMLFAVDGIDDARFGGTKTCSSAFSADDRSDPTPLELLPMLRDMGGFRDQCEISDPIIERIATAMMDNEARRYRAENMFPVHLGAGTPDARIGDLDPRPRLPLFVSSDSDIADICVLGAHAKQYNMGIAPCL